MLSITESATVYAAIHPDFQNSISTTTWASHGWHDVSESMHPILRYYDAVDEFNVDIALVMRKCISGEQMVEFPSRSSDFVGLVLVMPSCKAAPLDVGFSSGFS